MDVEDTATIEALKPRIYATLTTAYLWLYRTAEIGGSWGEVRSTALAGICLALREPKGSPWREGVQKWLEARQKPMGADGGCWGEELWDTSMSVIALVKLGTPTGKVVIRKALRWQLELYNLNGNLNWHDEPWETAWTVLSLLEAGNGRYDRGEAHLATRWLVGLQDASGRIVAPHYTAYFLQIYARLRADLEHDPTFERAAARAVAYLVDTLDRDRLWTGEAWSNGQILWSFLMIGTLEDLGVERIRSIVSWFGGEQDERGGWRDDVEDTASSILGLHQLLRGLEATTLRNGTQADLLVAETLRKELEAPLFPSARRRWYRDPENKTITISLFQKDQKLAGTVVLVVSTVSLVITFWEQLSGLFRALLGLFVR